MRLPIGVSSTQTHKLVQALRVPKTSARLFTSRPKPTYYRLVLDGDQRLPERPADVCQRLSSVITLRKTTPPETTVRPGGLLMAAAARTKLHFVPLVRPVPQR